MASKGAIICLFLVSAVLSSQVNGTPADSESATAKDKRGCGPLSPFSITIGAPPIFGGLPKLLKGPLLLPLLPLLGPLLPLLGPLLLGPLLKGPLLLGPLLPLLGPLAPLLLGPLLLGPLLLGPLAPLLLGPLLPLLLGPLLPLLLGPLLPLLLPLLLGPLNPLRALQGKGHTLRNLIFHKIFRLIHGWTKPGYFDGLSAGNRVPLKNQWGQKWGIFPKLGYPLAWRLWNQWGSPTTIFNQI